MRKMREGREFDSRPSRMRSYRPNVGDGFAVRACWPCAAAIRRWEIDPRRDRTVKRCSLQACRHRRRCCRRHFGRSRSSGRIRRRNCDICRPYSCRCRRTDPSSRASRCKNHPSSVRRKKGRTNSRRTAERTRNSTDRDAKSGRSSRRRMDPHRGRRNRRTGRNDRSVFGMDGHNPCRRARRSRRLAEREVQRRPAHESDAASARTPARSRHHTRHRPLLGHSRPAWRRDASRRGPGPAHNRCWSAASPPTDSRV